MKKLQVKVKAKHIRATREEKKYDAFSCPVARALEEACPNYRYAVYAWAFNGKPDISIYSGDNHIANVPQPEPVAAFVSQFDGGYPYDPRPFQFTIEVPDEMECP